MSFREMVFKLYKGAEVHQSRAIFWVNQHGARLFSKDFVLDCRVQVLHQTCCIRLATSFNSVAALNLTRLDDAAIVWPGLGK